MQHGTNETNMTATTTGVPTPIRGTIYAQLTTRNATRHDADKPTTNVATSIMATPTKIPCIADGPRDVLRHDIIERMLSVEIATTTDFHTTPTGASRRHAT
jgi:hypothetical protein